MIPGFPGASPKPERRGRKPPKRIERKVRPNPFRRSPGGAAYFARHERWRELIMGMSKTCLIRKVCEGRAAAVDPCHLWGVGPHKALAHHPQNAVPGCRACHDYFTPRPDEWRAWIVENVRSSIVSRLATLACLAQKTKTNFSEALDNWIEAGSRSLRRAMFRFYDSEGGIGGAVLVSYRYVDSAEKKAGVQ